jgi:WD40 repeat protein
VKCWDAASGNEVLTLKDPGLTVGLSFFGGECVAFSPDGKRLAANGGLVRFGATVQIWHADSGQRVLAIEEQRLVMFASLAFSPDAKHLATASMKSVKLWDAASGKEVLTFNQDSSGANCVAFSPDGKRLAAASNDGTVKLWDPASGKKIMTFKGHSSAVKTVAFSPDGKRLASASGSSRKKGVEVPFIELKVWDAANGHELLSMEGHTGAINSVAFSPDGKRLVTASNDGTVKLWDTDSGEDVLTLRGHTSGVKSVAFSPDGNRLASASNDAILIWNASKSLPEARQK